MATDVTGVTDVPPPPPPPPPPSWETAAQDKAAALDRAAIDSNVEPTNVEPREQAAAEPKGIEAKDDTTGMPGDRTAQDTPGDKAARLDSSQPIQTTEAAPPDTSDHSKSVTERPDISPTSSISPTSRTDHSATDNSTSVPPALDKVEDKPAGTPTGPTTPDTPESKAERLDPPQPPQATEADTGAASEAATDDKAVDEASPPPDPSKPAIDGDATPEASEPAAEAASEAQADDEQHPPQSSDSDPSDAAAPPGGPPPDPPDDGPPGNGPPDDDPPDDDPPESSEVSEADDGEVSDTDGNGEPTEVEARPISNKLPDLLQEELDEADSLGVEPLSPDDGDAFDELVNGDTVKWAVLQNGELKVMPAEVGGTEIAHPVLSSGDDVLAAGEAEISGTQDSGYYSIINNKSGHFEPDDESLEIGRQAFERFSTVVIVEPWRPG